MWKNDMVPEQFRNFSSSVPHDDDMVHIVRPIGYTSCLFKGAMKNYTILEKEATAIIKALAYFQQHLYCSPKAYVLTDSQSFLWALRFRSLGISRLERICIKLLSVPFKIIITHVKGEGQPADFLTRIYKVPSSDSGITNALAKQATVVSTPFPVGQIVTPAQILQKIQELPD
jgi:hypothetical protein